MADAGWHGHQLSPYRAADVGGEAEEGLGGGGGRQNHHGGLE